MVTRTGRTSRTWKICEKTFARIASSASGSSAVPCTFAWLSLSAVNFLEMYSAVARVKARGPCRASSALAAAETTPCTSAASSDVIASPPRVGAGRGSK
eukprot:2918984-Alexandrium_andersonii.AAC.1